MATTVQNATRRAWRWRLATRDQGPLPAAVVATIGLALAWALARPFITYFAAMVRTQPVGSEQMYLVGLATGIALDLAFYGFLAWFLLRGYRWAQVTLVAASLLQAVYWGAQLAASSGGYALAPANFPLAEPLVTRDAMYLTSALVPALTAIVALLPATWRWTRRAPTPGVEEADA